MRQFIDIIAEAVVSKLYHGTSIEALAGILSSGAINASPPDDYDDGHVGVSLTFDFDTAMKFAEEAKERDWDNQWNSPVNDSVVLAFAQNAISNTVGGKKVLWDGSNSEAEFRTFGPIPASMITDVKVDKPSLEWWIESFEETGDDGKAAALRELKERL